MPNAWYVKLQGCACLGADVGSEGRYAVDHYRGTESVVDYGLALFTVNLSKYGVCTLHAFHARRNKDDN